MSVQTLGSVTKRPLGNVIIAEFTSQACTVCNAYKFIVFHKIVAGQSPERLLQETSCAVA
eukprot:11173847-Karenia_brevis.AAC.1